MLLIYWLVDLIIIISAIVLFRNNKLKALSLSIIIICVIAKNLIAITSEILVIEFYGVITIVIFQIVITIMDNRILSKANIFEKENISNYDSKKSYYFISYSRKDSKFALKLSRDLRAKNALIWLDQIDIKGGELWDESVEKAIENCTGMIVILSSNSVNSKNVLDEISEMLEKNKIVIPVIYENCKIPFRIKRINSIDFSDYSEGLERLLNSL